MPDAGPLVSILINNYNYGQFISEAIDSALQQTYPHVEVIVVDDGSVDQSREVIASYGTRIISVLKANGGQASAFNAGFARSHGAVIIFLDADDQLLPDTAQRVADVFYHNPYVAKVQYRLEVIDGQGTRTGQIKPPRSQAMLNGDLRRHVLSFPDDIAWLPTSGNAFAAVVLRAILPMPEPIYRICADYYLSNLTPLGGLVVSLEDVGGYYRIHNANNHHTSRIELAQIWQTIQQTCSTHAYLKQYADTLGPNNFPSDPTKVLAVTFIAHRMVSLKLAPAQHPIKQDTVLRLFSRGVRAAWGRFDAPLRMKLMYVLWFAALVPAPPSMARKLAELFFYPETREQFSRIFGMLQRKRRSKYQLET